MVDVIAETMRRSTINELTTNNKMIPVIIDESTSLLKASCLIIYLRSVVNDFPVNIFLGILELEDKMQKTFANVCWAF